MLSSALAAATREDFENSALSPFSTEGAGPHTAVITAPPFGARAGSLAHQLTWLQAQYTGSCSTRSVEGTSGNGNGNLCITNEGWYGFSFYLPANGFPADKSTIIAQIHAWDSSLPATDKTAVIGYQADGSLLVESFYGVGDGGALATGSITLWPSGAGPAQRNRWHDLILHISLANNQTGGITAWLEGAPEATPTGTLKGISVGNGAWTSANEMTIGAYIKWGLYCWDTANHTPNETRTIFFDELAYQG